MASSLKRIRWKYNPTESIHLIHLPVISGRHPAPIVNLFNEHSQLPSTSKSQVVYRAFLLIGVIILLLLNALLSAEIPQNDYTFASNQVQVNQHVLRKLLKTRARKLPIAPFARSPSCCVSSKVSRLRQSLIRELCEKTAWGRGLLVVRDGQQGGVNKKHGCWEWCG